MIATNAIAVAVAAGDKYGEVVVGQLGAGGHGQGAAMKSMHPVGIEITRQVGGTPDAADGQYLVRLQTQLRAGALQGVEDAEITASRAPVGIDLPPEVPRGQLNLGPAVSYAYGCHCITSFAKTCGLRRWLGTGYICQPFILSLSKDVLSGLSPSL